MTLLNYRVKRRGTDGKWYDGSIPDGMLHEILMMIGAQIEDGQYSGVVRSLPKRGDDGKLIYPLDCQMEVWWRIETGCRCNQ